MAVTFRDRLMHGWNAFMNKDPTEKKNEWDMGPSYTRRPDIVPFSRKVEQTIVNGVYTKIAIDVSQLKILHVRLNDDGKYESTINSKLNYCLTTEANIDQTARSFIQDVVNNMFDEGVVAIVPVDTTIDPTKSGSFDVETMRVGRIVQWYPEFVKVDIYNDKTGKREEITVPKKTTAIHLLHGRRPSGHFLRRRTTASRERLQVRRMPALPPGLPYRRHRPGKENTEEVVL